ncbi:MAG: hypothetical protein WCQ21_17710 [Verrucomicrobiota bacterium]
MKTSSLISVAVVWLWLGGAAGIAASKSTAFFDRVQVTVPGGAGAVLKNIPGIVARQVERRCGAKVAGGGSSSFTLELAVEPGIGKEGFSIADGPQGAVRILGNDDRGVLYGVGKFLRNSRYERGFAPGAWRGVSVPEKPLRGIYFATHFYNYYQTAPVEAEERYVEELALWGVNSVAIWYDMHHFKGFGDPEAVAFRGRLKRILQAARRCGVGVGLMVIGNEAYADSPKELRADPRAQRGGFYDVAVCPNKPGGLDYTLKILGELFDWASDLQPEYVCIWPYDQGGCGCDPCRPWGANGFLKCAENVANLARRKLPGVKTILSTWMFDANEWQGLKRAFSPKPGWADIILTESVGFAREGISGMPTIGFPEISMEGMFPWGGFGANPQPQRFQADWNVVKDKEAGGYPYSEGIFEDINKVIWAQLYWNPAAPVADTLKEYIAYEYSPAVVEGVRKVIATLEQNHHFRWWPGELAGVKLQYDWFPSRGVKPQADPGAEDAYAAVKQLDEQLAPWARGSWRWRILYLRALLDSELKTNGGNPTPACERGFRELVTIYGLTDKADPAIKPPVTP